MTVETISQYIFTLLFESTICCNVWFIDAFLVYQILCVNDEDQLENVPTMGTKLVMGMASTSNNRVPFNIVCTKKPVFKHLIVQVEFILNVCCICYFLLSGDVTLNAVAEWERARSNTLQFSEKYHSHLKSLLGIGWYSRTSLKKHIAPFNDLMEIF